MIYQSRFSDIDYKILDKIKDYLANAIPNSNATDFDTILREITSPYSNLLYNCIPLNMERGEDYPDLMAYIVINHLNLYRNVFQNCDKELKLLGLKFDKNGTDNTTTNNTKQNSGSSNGMSENAPINADINSIVSPNTKAQTATSATQNDNGSSENIYNESNPYYYDTFLSIIKRYNIPSIINSGIQKILVEYSTII